MQAAILADQEVRGAVSSLLLVSHGVDRIGEGRRLAAPLISDEPREQRLVLRGAHPDLIELTPPTGKEKIGIDRVREVIRQGQFAPVQGRRKVCLVARAEALTLEAANALLKVLEEPPRGLVFLLLAEHTGDILPTILSRSRVVRLTPPSQGDLLAQLTTAGYPEEEGRYLLDVARRNGEIDRFFATRVDLPALRAQARESAKAATADALIAMVTAADPVLRREGILSLLERLIGEEAELIAVGVRLLAQAGRETVTVLLEDLLYLAFDLVRASVIGCGPYQDETLLRFSYRVKTERLLQFCASLERARRAVEGYAPLEAVLLWLLLTAGRLTDG